MNKIFCLIFGHEFIEINKKDFSARCYVCEKKYYVSYDMSYGETIVISKYKDAKK